MRELKFQNQINQKVKTPWHKGGMESWGDVGNHPSPLHFELVLRRARAQVESLNMGIPRLDLTNFYPKHTLLRV